MNEKTHDPARRFAAGAALAAVTALLAAAQFRCRRHRIRMVVPFAAGGGSDVIARLVADGLREALQGSRDRGEPRRRRRQHRHSRGGPGHADGRTLLFTPQSPITIAHLLEPKPSFDAEKDFVPIAIMAKTPLVLLVNAAVPGQDHGRTGRALQGQAQVDLLRFARATEFAFTTELLAREAGLEMTGVPYRGSAPAMTDLLGGSIQVLLSSAGAAKAQLQGWQGQGVAVMGAARSAGFSRRPDRRRSWACAISRCTAGSACSHRPRHPKSR